MSDLVVIVSEVNVNIAERFSWIIVSTLAVMVVVHSVMGNFDHQYTQLEGSWL